MARTLEEIKKEISKEQLEELYVNQLIPRKKLAKQLGIYVTTLDKLVLVYDLTRNRSKLNSRWRSHKFYDLVEKVSKEKLHQDYIVDNKTQKQLYIEYDTTPALLDKLINYYGENKPKSQSAYVGINTKLKKYGATNNWQKGHETRIKNSGSLEASYKAAYEKQKQVCKERYGRECMLNGDVVDQHRHKRDTTPNKRFAGILNHNFLKFEQEFPIETKSYDFKVGNILFEVNPIATHNSTWSPYGNHEGLKKQYHRDKTRLASENGYRCIHVWDWDDAEKVVRSSVHTKVVYARQCEVRGLETYAVNDFLNEYHLQGTCKNQTYNYGLYYKDELVELMTFGKPRYNRNYEYELLRLCTKFDYIVVGGAERLFKHFLKEQDPNSIISYCDLSKFTGEVYTRLGFKLKANAQPSKHWYNERDKIHVTDNLLRQQGFDRLFGTELGKDASNEALMLEHGFLEVYDAGQATYIWKKDN